MKPLRPLLALITPPLLISALLSGLAQRPEQVPRLTQTQPTLNCTRPPTYRVGYELEKGSVVAQGTGFQLGGASWLEVDVCVPGTLTLTADGQVAAGEAPRLEVALNSKQLASERFAQQRTVRVRLPEAGRLTLAYFNDYYRSDARVATLENFRLEGAACGTFQATVPPATGGSWSAQTNTATLVSSVPMTVRPCAPGKLRVRVVGRAGGRAFPTVRFEQQGRTLLELKTRQSRQAVTLDVAPSPVTITLLNPYFKELANRNLNIRKLEFTPDVPRSP